MNSLEIADAGFGSVSTSASRSRAATSAGGISPVNVTRDAQFSCAANAFTRARSGSFSCPPTISPRVSGSAATASIDQVDALPRIEVARVADGERSGVGSVRIRRSVGSV